MVNLEYLEHMNWFLEEKEPGKFLFHYFHDDKTPVLDGECHFNEDEIYESKDIIHRGKNTLLLCQSDSDELESITVLLTDSQHIGELKFHHWRYGPRTYVGASY